MLWGIFGVFVTSFTLAWASTSRVSPPRYDDRDISGAYGHSDRFSNAKELRDQASDVNGRIDPSRALHSQPWLGDTDLGPGIAHLRPGLADTEPGVDQGWGEAPALGSEERTVSENLKEAVENIDRRREFDAEGEVLADAADAVSKAAAEEHEDEGVTSTEAGAE